MDNKKEESRFIGVDDRKVESKRLIIFLAITFVVTWITEITVLIPMYKSGEELAVSEASKMISSMMFTPAIAAVVSRIFTREGMLKSGLQFNISRYKGYFLFSWFGPSILIFLGAVLYFIINRDNYDTNMGVLIKAISESNLAAGITDEIDVVDVVATYKTGLLIKLFTAPVLDVINAFGEEWGFRGYLLPKLYRKLGTIPAVLISGIVNGIWYAPIVAIGYFYGNEYAGFPVAGILGMIVFCTVTGTIYSYVCLRTGSIFTAVFAHSAVNIMMSQADLFTVNGGNPFIGPAPTGIIGGIPFIIVAAICIFDLYKRPIKAGSND